MAKIQFIMFPGFGVSKKGWGTNFVDGKIIKNNFINKLKKLGSVYFYEPKYYNIFYYYGDEMSKLYDKNINFTKSDLDINVFCKQVYNEVKDFDGKFVLIGHSLGAYPVHYFSEKYSSKCLCSIIIDGVPLGPIDKTENDNKLMKTMKKYQKYDDKYINILKDKIYKNDKKAIDELSEIIRYNLYNYIETAKKIKTFKIPTVCFYNFKIRIQKNKQKAKKDQFRLMQRVNEINHFTKNNNSKKYKSITFINKTHLPHFIDDSLQIIIDNIKKIINKKM